MNEESPDFRIDPELEARIVAMVLGEASDFECDELSRRMQEMPELAAFAEQIRQVHGMLQDMGRDDQSVEGDDWKLSAENRQAVLSVLGGVEENLSAIEPAKMVAERPSRLQANWYSTKNLMNFAAVVCVVGVGGYLALLAWGTRSFDLRQLSLAPSAMKKSDGLVDESRGKPDALTPELESKQSVQYESEGLDLIAGATQSYQASPPPASESPPPASESLRSDFKSEVPAESSVRTVPGWGTQIVELPPEVDALSSVAHGAPVDRPALSDESLGNAVTGGYGGGGVGGAPYSGAAPYGGAAPSGGGGGGYGGSAGYGGGGGGYGGGAPNVVGRSRYGLGSGGPGGKDLEAQLSSPQLGQGLDGVDNGLTNDVDGEANQLSIAGPNKPADAVAADGRNEPLSSDSEVMLGDVGAQPAEMSAKESATWHFESQPGAVAARTFTRLQTELSLSGESEFARENGSGPTQHKGLLLQNSESPVLAELNQPVSRARQQAERDPVALRGRSVLPLGGYGFNPVPLSTSGDQPGATKYLPAGRIAVPGGLDESHADEIAVSTFSLHVSDVSFKLAQAALAQGEWPEASRVRIEEFVNAFDYGDPMPQSAEHVACHLEQSIHPFLQQRNLLRVSMRTAAAGRSNNTPLRLTLLIDNSGSMERSDRRQALRRAFSLLSQQLRPTDQVTLISFARQPRLLADRIPGNESQQLVKLIDELPSEGGTNIEAALQLALEKAKEQQTSEAQNRIVLLTDGAVNLGNANPASLSQMVVAMRNSGIAFDAAGIIADGVNDDILEALTRKGDGRYYLLDTLESADHGFARQIAGALRPSAKNVKVQIEFNPERVGHYKLLGFEKHLLQQEDFRNDSVDAAEMAAAEAGVAVYQFEVKPDGVGDVGSVSVRFRDMSTGQMIENRWPIPYEADPPAPEQAAPSMRIATSAAMLAAKLRGGALGDSVDLNGLAEIVAGLPAEDRNGERVQQLQKMIQQAQQISRE